MLPAGARTAAKRGARPNLLILTADDMGWDTPGCQGGHVPGVTPNIDRLALEGMRFARAHVTVSICLPSRAVLATGRYPHRNGALGFQDIRPDVPLLTDVLAAADYLVGNLGKVDHLRPRARFRWDLAPDDSALGFGRDPHAYAAHARAFFARARREKRPFLLLANSHDPHRPFHGTAAERARLGERLAAVRPPSRVYRPDEVVVPGFLPDLPEVRAELAAYLSSSRRCDDTVGAVLEALDDAGLAQETIVVFLSDNGMAFPFAKTNCYLHSTRVPWIVRWPGRIAAGAVDAQHLVNGIDLMPTLVDLAGLRMPRGADGRSLAPLLEAREPAADAWRQRLFTVFHQTFRGRRFEMRAVQDLRHGYIWNPWSDGRRRFEAEAQKTPTMAAMRAAAARNPAIAARVRFHDLRVPEELYDLGADPDALRNRIDDASLSGERNGLRAALRDWMARTADPLRAQYPG